jgi:hypothetical protein
VVRRATRVILFAWIFEAREAEEGGYYARGLGHSIFTEADTWEELRGNVVEAAGLHFEDAFPGPRTFQLQLVKGESIKAGQV